MPTAKETSPPPKPKDTPILPLNVEAEFSEVFSEEFAAQAETQLEEAMKMMQSENPDLWKQFEDFSSTLGIPPGGVASHGESSVDSGGEAAKKSGGREESLAGVFEETLQKMKQNTEGLGVSVMCPLKVVAIFNSSISILHTHTHTHTPTPTHTHTHTYTHTPTHTRTHTHTHTHTRMHTHTHTHVCTHTHTHTFTSFIHLVYLKSTHHNSVLCPECSEVVANFNTLSQF